ncbi:hypothetical protein W02_05220 [Nitrospira sp. KM1]|nr:hypothetical protein W02_05220 [Nitrospira sp. KM1]
MAYSLQIELATSFPSIQQHGTSSEFGTVLLERRFIIYCLVLPAIRIPPVRYSMWSGAAKYLTNFVIHGPVLMEQ